MRLGRGRGIPAKRLQSPRHLLVREPIGGGGGESPYHLVDRECVPFEIIQVCVVQVVSDMTILMKATDVLDALRTYPLLRCSLLGAALVDSSLSTLRSERICDEGKIRTNLFQVKDFVFMGCLHGAILNWQGQRRVGAAA